MQSWLVVANHVEKHIGSWSYIGWSTGNWESEGTADSVGLILYLVYAVLSMKSWLWHGRTGRDNITLGYEMTGELWMGNRKWVIKINTQCRTWQHIRNKGCWLRIWVLKSDIGVLTWEIRIHNCLVWIVALMCIQCTPTSQRLIMILPKTSHLSHLHPQLYHPPTIRYYAIPQYFSSQWS